MEIELEEKTKKALLWIIEILNQQKISFQISGGFAAKLYGSARSLNDIDIDIPENEFTKIVTEVKGYITFGPRQFKDKKWDIFLMTLNYFGQEIDIGSENFKIFDSNSKQWLSFSTVPNKVIWMPVAGITVPVIAKEELIHYKSYLDGEHQKTDIDTIQ